MQNKMVVMYPYNSIKVQMYLMFLEREERERESLVNCYLCSSVHET